MSACVKECRIEHGEIIHAPGCGADLEKLTDAQLAELEAALGAKVGPAQPVLMTMNEARVSVASMLNEVLSNASAAVLAAQAQDTDTESNEYKNGSLMVAAAREFVAANTSIIKRCRQKRILTTPNGMKVRL